MKAAQSLSLVLVLLAASFASANTYVKCGRTADFLKGEVTGYELELSSEGDDDYSGMVGKKWNMKLGNENSEWLQPNKNITAKTLKVNEDTIVEILIKRDRSVSGPIGTKYKLIGLYDENPTLEKYSVGGFGGTLLEKTFQCLTGHD